MAMDCTITNMSAPDTQAILLIANGDDDKATTMKEFINDTNADTTKGAVVPTIQKNYEGFTEYKIHHVIHSHHLQVMNGSSLAMAYCKQLLITTYLFHGN